MDHWRIENLLQPVLDIFEDLFFFFGELESSNIFDVISVKDKWF
jgi:hypothetical protein